MGSQRPLYDDIGRSYSTTRREDPRVAAQIWDGLGTCVTVLNVGAGTGNYEPSDRFVVAVEPSAAMVRQRTGRSPHVARAVAAALPFRNGAFDAAMAVLTMHHWPDPAAGLAELRRVSARQVVLFFEPLHTHNFWALDYFPDAKNIPSEQNAPGEALLAGVLRLQEVQTVLVPADCIDGFGAAFWCRPEAYLDPEVQAGMSWIALMPDAARREGTQRLAADLESGEWDRRYGELRQLPTFDAGYRLAIAY